MQKTIAFVKQARGLSKDEYRLIISGKVGSLLCCAADLSSDPEITPSAACSLKSFSSFQ
jgi:hypothetical protein